jgi:protein TonB
VSSSVRRDGARDLASQVPTVLCVVLIHASLIAWMPALGPSASTAPVPIAVQLLEPVPVLEPPRPLEATRPPVPLPAAATASPRPVRKASPERLPAPVQVPARPADSATEPNPVVASPTVEDPPGVTAVDGPGPAVAVAQMPGRDAAAVVAQSRPQAEPVVPGTPARHDADYLRNPAPAYPAISRRLRETGRVVLRVVVSPDGEALAVEIERGSGHERLDAAARRAVAGWRFVPARRGDVPIQASVLVPIVFRLDD